MRPQTEELIQLLRASADQADKASMHSHAPLLRELSNVAKQAAARLEYLERLDESVRTGCVLLALANGEEQILRPLVPPDCIGDSREVAQRRVAHKRNARMWMLGEVKP